MAAAADHPGGAAIRYDNVTRIRVTSYYPKPAPDPQTVATAMAAVIPDMLRAIASMPTDRDSDPAHAPRPVARRCRPGHEPRRRLDGRGPSTPDSSLSRLTAARLPSLALSSWAASAACANGGVVLPRGNLHQKQANTFGGRPLNHAPAIGLVAILVLCGCSHKSGATNPTTSGAATAGTVPGSSPPGASAGTPPTTARSIGLPPPDPAAIAPTKAALADPGTSSWLATALTATQVAPSDVCATPPAVMAQPVAAKVVILGDVVLSELLINLDSALGGIGLACGTGDTATAVSELTDAQAAARAISARLEELNR